MGQKQLEPAWAVVISGTRDQFLDAEREVAFVTLINIPVLGWSLRAFEDTAEIESVLVVADRTRLGEVENMVRLLGYAKVRKIVAGAGNWLRSLRAALEALEEEEPAAVVVHSAARPLVRPETVAAVLAGLRRHEVAVAGQRLQDEIKLTTRSGKVTKTLAGNACWAAHTPQAVRFADLQRAVNAAMKKKQQRLGEDISLLWEKSRRDIVMVPESMENVRITSYESLHRAAALASGPPVS